MSTFKVGTTGIGDMLYFANKYKEREKIIETASADPLTKSYETNRKAAERHPDEQRFIIKDILSSGPDVKTFVLSKEDGSNPAFFRAGQYIVLRQEIEGNLIARPVSLSCGPARSLEGEYTITVKGIPDGFMSQYILNNWKIGDTVVTSGPQGVFYYEPYRDAKKVIAVAGGSGITPILSMAYAIADGDEDFELTVLYGTRSRKDILFAEEFEQIQKKTDKLKVVHVLSEEKAEGYEYGFVTEALIKKYMNIMGEGPFSIFAAGPQGMYQFLDGEIEKIGLLRKYYRKELFGSVREPWKLPGYPQEAKGQTFNLHVKMCDREYDIPCRADENMIVALERAGIAGPNRCRGGICGWCRSRLLSGEVFIPEETDGRREADKVYGFIHPCASFAVSDVSIEVPFNK